jgi:hypothetical protein
MTDCETVIKEVIDTMVRGPSESTRPIKEGGDKARHEKAANERYLQTLIAEGADPVYCYWLANVILKRKLTNTECRHLKWNRKRRILIEHKQVTVFCDFGEFFNLILDLFT